MLSRTRRGCCQQDRQHLWLPGVSAASCGGSRLHIPPERGHCTAPARGELHGSELGLHRLAPFPFHKVTSVGASEATGENVAGSKPTPQERLKGDARTGRLVWDGVPPHHRKAGCTSPGPGGIPGEGGWVGTHRQASCDNLSHSKPQWLPPPREGTKASELDRNSGFWMLSLQVSSEATG